MSSRPRRLPRDAGVLLGALLAAVLVTGCGSSSQSSASATSATPADQTTGATAPSQKATPGGSTGAQAQVPGTSTGASGHATAPAPSPPTGGRLLRRFAGTGNGRVGTIVVSAPSTLVWRARRSGIQIFTSSGFMLVNSPSTTGAIRLSHGTYRDVRVASGAGWLIELRSASS